MKKSFLVLSAVICIINVAMLSLGAARGGKIILSELTRVNSVKVVNQINIQARDDEFSFVAAALTRTDTVGGMGYDFIMWTEQEVSAEQAKIIIAYVAANIKGRLSKISYDNTFVAGGNPYEWRAANDRGKALTFSRYIVSQNNSSILSTFAYGLYAFESETTASITETASAPETTRPNLTQITQTSVPEHGQTSLPSTQTSAPETTRPSLTQITQTTVPEHGLTSLSSTQTSAPETTRPHLTQITQTTVPEHGQTSHPSAPTVTASAARPTDPVRIPQLGNDGK